MLNATANPKESLQPQFLATLVERRLRAVPALHAAIEQDPSFTLRVGRPRLHARDSHGRNWNIDAFQTGFLHWPQSHGEFRAIVDGLRAEYDLA
jgi:hypothetical protein